MIKNIRKCLYVLPCGKHWGLFFSSDIFAVFSQRGKLVTGITPLVITWRRKRWESTITELFTIFSSTLCLIFNPCSCSVFPTTQIWSQPWISTSRWDDLKSSHVTFVGRQTHFGSRATPLCFHEKKYKYIIIIIALCIFDKIYVYYYLLILQKDLLTMNCLCILYLFSQFIKLARFGPRAICL